MSTAGKILHHISNLGANVVFTTGEMLLHGSRSAVDSALSRLVRKEVIRRLAAGVFIAVEGMSWFPSALVIIIAKARAFKKRVFESSGGNEPSNSNIFLTDGCRTSIATVHGRLHFRTTSMRKLREIEIYQLILKAHKLLLALTRTAPVLQAATPSLSILKIIFILTGVIQCAIKQLISTS